jgi:hypothetical protein
MGGSLAQERQMKSYIALSTCHYNELQKSTQQFSQVTVRKELIGNLRGELPAYGIELRAPTWTWCSPSKSGTEIFSPERGLRAKWGVSACSIAPQGSRLLSTTSGWLGVDHLFQMGAEEISGGCYRNPPETLSVDNVY